jgi:hypothetical protein
MKKRVAMSELIGGPSAGARALRAFATELAVGRIRDLDFYDNRENSWWMISSNREVTLDFVKALPHKPWKPSAFKYNPAFSAGDIVEYAKLQKGARDVYYSSKPDFTFADLERMAFAEDCSLESTVIDSRRFAMMRHAFGTENPNMTWELYQRYFRGDYDCLTNPAVANARAIRENPTFPWDSEVNRRLLIMNPAMGAEALAELEQLYPGLFWWDWARYSWSDAVTWEIVKRFWDKPWNMAGLSRNKRVVTWKRLAEYPDGLVRAGDAADADGSRAWNWKSLSANPAIATWKRICEHPELPWWSEGLAINRAVCVWEAIAAPPPGQPRAGPSCWKPSQYCFIWSRVQFVGDAERAEWARRWMAAWKIQRRWLSLYYTPGTRVWLCRMMWDVSGLQSELGGTAVAAPVAAAAAS